MNLSQTKCLGNYEENQTALRYIHALDHFRQPIDIKLLGLSSGILLDKHLVHWFKIPNLNLSLVGVLETRPL